MKRTKPFEDFDRPFRKDDPLREVRQIFARMQIETGKILRQAGVDLDAMFREERDKMEKLLRGLDAFLDARPPTPKRPPRPRRKPRGGSEPVTVEPNRPKQGEGGAAAALEFDE